MKSCEKLPKVAKRCQKLPKVVSKLSIFRVSYQYLGRVLSIFGANVLLGRVLSIFRASFIDFY